MEQITHAIQSMIQVSDEELGLFLSSCFTRTFKKKVVLNRPGAVPQEIYFINKGIVRALLTDKNGVEQSIHFALENQFFADYSAFLQQIPSVYSLETLEETEVVLLPRSSVEWGYANLAQGDRLGRLIAEFYFIYQDNRISNQYARSPKERYDSIAEVFPNIHNRVPQHMIASYLGISPIHLSRLKKQDSKKS